MLLEVRSYTVKDGKRDEFVDWFESDLLPAMQSCGISVLGQFTSIEDASTFVWLRAFVDEADKAAKYAAFYETADWTDRMQPRARELVESIEVKIMEPTAGSAIR